MTITIETNSVDESGRLVHAEDAAAQLCLAFERLEAALAAHGLGASSIVRLRVSARAPAYAADLADLVVEWLDGIPVPVDLVDVAHLALPGTLVELSALVIPTPSDPKDRP
ncbi:Rid family hydrolase [Nocardia sp. NPDC050718]|uniref:Rid family hydrolase n=1 Tax=Nocardia sp. NPDC050718 TaxID=3155788 RepID=UPI0034037B23